jgi:hypothetical protein
MFGNIIRALIYLCFIAIVFYLVLWVLGSLGIALPFMVVSILKVVFVLIAILVLWQLFGGAFAGFNWWGKP